MTRKKAAPKAAPRKAAATKKKDDEPALPPNELGAILATRQEANVEAHAELLEQRLAAAEYKRMALAAEPTVPAEKRPI